jgi:hypothetical protein
MAEGETKATVAARVKVWLTIAEWETIKAAFNHGAVIPPESTREVIRDTNMPCISKGSTCYREKVKYEKDVSQLVHQVRYYERSAATHHIPMAEGSTCMVLGWIT